MRTVLAERDRRAARIAELAAGFGGTIIQLTICVPGLPKNNEEIREAAAFGGAVLALSLEKRGWKSLFSETWQGEAGPCHLWVVAAQPRAVKELTVGLESSSILGRIWDFDVFEAGGRKLDREVLGLQARTCFLCGNPAAVCSGRQSHHPEEVVRYFRTLLTRGIQELRDGMANDSVSL